MFYKIPASHFFTSGAAEGETRPNALDAARLAAGIGDVNLVETGPAVPGCCRMVEARELPAGTLAPAVCASITSDMPTEVISAGVAVAYPVEDGQPALAMKHAASGHKEDIESQVRRMAKEGLRRRGLEVREIRSIAVQHRVETLGAAVAAVILAD